MDGALGQDERLRYQLTRKSDPYGELQVRAARP
jgi:hypothetical protein